jgi:hypothetical protein
VTGVGSRNWARPLIIVVVLLAVILPFWGVFAGGMLRQGQYGAALQLFAMISGLMLGPAVASFVVLSVFRRLTRLPAMGLGIATGAMASAAVTTKPLALLLWGALSGAIVALMMVSGRSVAGSNQGGKHG